MALSADLLKNIRAVGGADRVGLRRQLVGSVFPNHNKFMRAKVAAAEVSGRYAAKKPQTVEAVSDNEQANTSHHQGAFDNDTVDPQPITFNVADDTTANPDSKNQDAQVEQAAKSTTQAAFKSVIQSAKAAQAEQAAKSTAKVAFNSIIQSAKAAQAEQAAKSTTKAAFNSVVQSAKAAQAEQAAKSTTKAAFNSVVQSAKADQAAQEEQESQWEKFNAQVITPVTGTSGDPEKPAQENQEKEPAHKPADDLPTPANNEILQQTTPLLNSVHLSSAPLNPKKTLLGGNDPDKVADFLIETFNPPSKRVPAPIVSMRTPVEASSDVPYQAVVAGIFTTIAATASMSLYMLLRM
jgi:hypothetical protein